MAKSQRTQYIVYRYVRFYYLSVWLLSILFILLVGAMFWFYQGIRAGQVLDLSTETGFWIYMGVVGVVFFLIFFAIAIGLHSIVNSHRIAGAAYAIKAGLGRTVSNDFSRNVNLREKDFLKELAEGVNDLMEQGRQRTEAKVELTKGLEELRRLAEQDGQAGGNALQEVVGRLDRSASSL